MNKNLIEMFTLYLNSRISLRLTARKALISEDAARNSNENMQVLKSESDDEGIVNLSYEQDPEAHGKDQKPEKRTGAAVLHFPQPPISSPSR